VKSFLKSWRRLRSVVIACAASVLCVCMPEARSEMFSLTVNSTSNIFLSGLDPSDPIPPESHANGYGTFPPSVRLPGGVGRVVQFRSVTGSVSYNDVDAPPDVYRSVQRS